MKRSREQLCLCFTPARESVSYTYKYFHKFTLYCSNMLWHLADVCLLSNNANICHFRIIIRLVVANQLASTPKDNNITSPYTALLITSCVESGSGSCGKSWVSIIA